MGAFDQFGEFLLGGFRERIKAGVWIYFRDQNFTQDVYKRQGMCCPVSRSRAATAEVRVPPVE